MKIIFDNFTTRSVPYKSLDSLLIIVNETSNLISVPD